VVVPLGVAGQRLYSRLAIGLALFLWSVVGLSSAEVRRQCSPWRHVGPSAAEGWAQLRRWSRALDALFPKVPRSGEAPSRTSVASVVRALSGFAQTGEFHPSEAAAVFDGARDPG
jgi:hypothetical protein